MQAGVDIVFYHVASMGNWREVFAEQLSWLLRSGYAGRLEVVLVGDAQHLGYLSCLLEAAEIDFGLEYGGDLSAYEYPTLTRLHRHAQAHPESLVGYFHTKGVSKTGCWVSTLWRWAMNTEVLERFADIELPAEKLVAGTSLRSNFPQGFWHFQGNFWIARASHVAGLPDPEAFARQENAQGYKHWYHPRWPAEYWVCGGTDESVTLSLNSLAGGPLEWPMNPKTWQTRVDAQTYYSLRLLGKDREVTPVFMKTELPSQDITLATRSDHKLRQLPAFLEHHMPYCERAVVLVDLRPGQTDREIRDYMEKHWGDKVQVISQTAAAFSNTLVSDLEKHLAQQPATGWVLHLDKDEFVSRPKEIPGIVQKLSESGAHYAEGWMACRFAPGMQLYPDDLRSYEAFNAAAPVRVEYIKHFGFNTRKIWLSRFPHARLHTADRGWHSGVGLMVLDHFTWTPSRLELIKEKLLWHVQHKAMPLDALHRYVNKELAVCVQAPSVIEIGYKTMIPHSCGLPGFFDYSDVYRYMVNKAPEGSTIVELGVYCGRSLCYMAEYATLIGKKLDIVGVDLFDLCERSVSDLHPPFETHEEHLESVQSEVKRCAPWCTPRLIKSDTAEAAKLFEDRSVFAVWVDAGHDVESACADITAWRPKIVKGGMFAGHDLAKSHPGVEAGLKRAKLPFRAISSRSWIANGPEFTS